MKQQLMLQTLLNQLKAQNPTAYNQIISMMNSGVNPREYLSRLQSSGAISETDIRDAQTYIDNYTSNQNRKTF